MADEGEELRVVRAELEELREFKSKTEKASATRSEKARLRAWFATKVFIGKNLSEALESWRKAKTPNNPLPAPETSNLAAAIVGRLVRVGLVTLALAILPTSLLIWQNVLVSKQNTLIAKQNAFFQRQIRQGAVQDYRARRAALILTLFKEKLCPGYKKPSVDKFGTEDDSYFVCWDAPARARSEAIEALAALEGSIRENPDEWPGIRLPKRLQLPNVSVPHASLTEANLRRANLYRATLYYADLSNADLQEADLQEADLQEANLSGANLHSARLQSSDLSYADLSYADLSDARMKFTRWIGADLTNANLVGADLSGCSYCAEGSSKTRWPEGFDPPASCDIDEVCSKLQRMDHRPSIVK